MSKVALVVGGGKSLGAFLCKGLAEAGYRVAVADMDADSAKLTASEIAEVHGAENVMAVQAKPLSDQQIADLAAYYASVPSKLVDLQNVN